MQIPCRRPVLDFLGVIAAAMIIVPHRRLGEPAQIGRGGATRFLAGAADRREVG
jgi:hypothetical protein